MKLKQFLCLAYTSSLLSACTAIPADGWHRSLQSAGHTAFVHMACTSDGVGRVLVDAFKGGLEGAVVGIGYTGELINEAPDGEAAVVVMGAVAAIGAGIGMGKSAGETLWQLPQNYQVCLQNQEALADKVPKV